MQHKKKQNLKQNFSRLLETRLSKKFNGEKPFEKFKLISKKKKSKIQ